MSFIRRIPRRLFSSTPAAAAAASPAVSLPRCVGVLGSGQMGTGIGFVSAVKAQLPVVFFDNNPAQNDKSRSFISQLLSKEVAKGRLTALASEAAMGRVHYVTSLDRFAELGVDFSIEAVCENLQVKSELFARLSKLLPPHAVLASNTSSISLTKLAASAGTAMSGRVIGMHFMNPVPVMSLIEIIHAIQTSPDTIAITLELAAAMGKTVTQSKDVPGFIANRLLMPYINEAFFVLAEGVASAKDIDQTMKLGTGVPMGPLTLADFIGLDTCLAIMKVLHGGLGDSKYRPAPLLQLMVDAGYHGKKSGRGVFRYDEQGKQAEPTKI